MVSFVGLCTFALLNIHITTLQVEAKDLFAQKRHEGFRKELFCQRPISEDLAILQCLLAPLTCRVTNLCLAHLLELLKGLREGKAEALAFSKLTLDKLAAFLIRPICPSCTLFINFGELLNEAVENCKLFLYKSKKH